jgi:hypothetical protein
VEDILLKRYPGLNAFLIKRYGFYFSMFLLSLILISQLSFQLKYPELDSGQHVIYAFE